MDSYIEFLMAVTMTVAVLTIIVLFFVGCYAMYKIITE